MENTGEADEGGKVMSWISARVLMPALTPPHRQHPATPQVWMNLLGPCFCDQKTPLVTLGFA